MVGSEEGAAGIAKTYGVGDQIVVSCIDNYVVDGPGSDPTAWAQTDKLIVKAGSGAAAKIETAADTTERDITKLKCKY